MAKYLTTKHESNTRAGAELLKEVLSKGQVSHAVHPTFGNVIKVRLPDGAGFWFNESTGELIGALERYTPR